MPNHVQNRLTFTGDPGEIHRLRETVQKDEVGPGSLDFNKLMPMPEELNIVCGSQMERGLQWYQKFVEEYGGELSDEPEYLHDHPEIPGEDWELGKQAYQNIEKYGFPTWYEWRVKHWGTKWNSYESIP